jgi:hypothetical protein
MCVSSHAARLWCLGSFWWAEPERPIKLILVKNIVHRTQRVRLSDAFIGTAGSAPVLALGGTRGELDALPTWESLELRSFLLARHALI